MNLLRLLLCSAAIGVIAAPSPAATRNQKRFDNLSFFLNAASADARGKLMAEDYHFYFNQRTGDGGSKEKSLESFENWDEPLHPDIKILDHRVDGDVWTITIVELNDFAKLIGFPGWKATETITFDDANRIREVIYVPVEGGKDYREYLNPALHWLKANKPDDLKDVYDLDKRRLIQTNASAKKWVALLKEWRAATK
jgi:hypothetical protein